MGSTRTLVNATITDVSDRPLTYAACPICYAKLLENLFCDKCRRLAREGDLSYRYCLVVAANDASMSANVTVFGSSLNGFLGGTPKQAHTLLQTCPDTFFWLETLRSCLVGRKVILGIKTPKTSMNPSTNLSTITSRLVNKNENLVATQIFPVSNNDDRTFYKALESKLSEPFSIASPGGSQIRLEELKSCERTTLRPHFLLPMSSGHYSDVERSRRSSFLSSLDSFASEKSRGYGVENLESDVSELSTGFADFTLQDLETTPHSRVTGSSEPDPISHVTGSSEPDPLYYVTGSREPDPLYHVTGSREPNPLSHVTGSSEPDPLSHVTGSSEPDPLYHVTGSSEPNPLSHVTGSSEPDPLSRASDSSKRTPLSHYTDRINIPCVETEQGLDNIGVNEETTDDYSTSESGCRNGDNKSLTECIGSLMNGVDFDESLSEETILLPETCTVQPRNEDSETESDSDQSAREDVDAERCMQTNNGRKLSASRHERTSGEHRPGAAAMNLVSLDDTSSSDTTDCDSSAVVCSLTASIGQLVPARCPSTAARETHSEDDSRGGFDSESSAKTVIERRTLTAGVQSRLDSFQSDLMTDTGTKGNAEDSGRRDSSSTDFDLAGITFSPWGSADVDAETTNGDGSYCCGNALKDVPDSENMWQFLDGCDAAAAEESKVGDEEIADSISARTLEGLINVKRVNTCHSKSRVEESYQDSDLVSESETYDSIADGSADMFDCSEELFDDSDTDITSTSEVARKSSNSVESVKKSEAFSEDMFEASQYSPIASQSLFSQSSDFESPALNTSTPLYDSRPLSHKVRRSTNLLKSALKSNHSRRNCNVNISCEVSGNFSGDLFD